MFIFWVYPAAVYAEKSDSLFTRYEAIYPAFAEIVDSLLSDCPDDCAYLMEMHRNTGSEIMYIDVQRFHPCGKWSFGTSECYGVISDGRSVIYLEGDKDYDLIFVTGDYYPADSIRETLGNYIDDSNFSMFVFDKFRFYTIGTDLKLNPISDVLLSNRDPYHITDVDGHLVYIPKYVSDDGYVKFYCQYYTEDHTEIGAVRHFPDIRIRPQRMKIRKLLSKNKETVNLSAIFFYDPISKYSEIRHCNSDIKPELRTVCEQVVSENRKHLINSIDESQPYVVRVWISEK